MNASGTGPARGRGPGHLVEGGPDSLLIIDADGDIAYVNASAERMFDYGREELVGRPHEVLLAGAFAERFEEAEAAAGPDDVRQIGADLDVHGRRKDGSEFPIEINYRRVRSDDGATEVAASVRDVSRRREAETDLREAMSLLSATLESTADGILVVSAEGRVAGANEQFAQMWGIPADLLASNDDDRVMGFVLDQLDGCPGVRGEGPRAVRGPGCGEQRRPRLPRRPGLRARTRGRSASATTSWVGCGASGT